MRCLIVIAMLIATVLMVAPNAVAQNDWQFPDPYFGALEFDISRPRPPQQRVEAPATVRPRPSRPRPHRHRPRWTTTGART